jgi:hypothetical protein
MSARKSPKRLELFVNSGSDFAIVDQHGTHYTPGRARRLYEDGEVNNSNLAFSRLAHFDFDVDKLKAYYDEENAIRRGK